jgi:glycosyltransferase involved in cell wall biosynthesis
VRFLGVVPRPAIGSFLAECAVFVLPSRAEAFGLALLEAAYYGKPIVCTRVGGVPEIIDDDVNGVIVESDDPPEMGRQILALLRDPERARRMGAEAHETVIARFLFRDRIGDYLAVYDGERRQTVPAASGAPPAPSLGGQFGFAGPPEIRPPATRPEGDSAVLR